MKTTDVLRVVDAYLAWLDGEGSLLDVEWLLGDKHHFVSQCLKDSLICDLRGRPYENITRDKAILAFAILLAMRPTSTPKQRPLPLDR